MKERSININVDVGVNQSNKNVEKDKSAIETILEINKTIHVPCYNETNIMKNSNNSFDFISEDELAENTKIESDNKSKKFFKRKRPVKKINYTFFHPLMTMIMTMFQLMIRRERTRNIKKNEISKDASKVYPRSENSVSDTDSTREDSSNSNNKSDKESENGKEERYRKRHQQISMLKLVVIP